MLGAPLVVYMFMLLGALVIGARADLAIGEMLAIIALGSLCYIVVLAWRTMMRDREHVGDESGVHHPSRTAGMQLPEPIVKYLTHHQVPFNWYAHTPADTAGQLAHVLHIRRDGVAKPVMVRADGTVWMAVVPADERVDLEALRELLHARDIELLDESELDDLFPDCELGAEPPFGRMFHIPTIVDSDLMASARLSFHGGRHDEAIEVDTSDYIDLERPLVAHFASRAQPAAAAG